MLTTIGWMEMVAAVAPGLDHPNDEELSFHPKQHKSLLGDPGLRGPVSETWGTWPRQVFP
jgi:hypothetical protein